MFEIEGLDLAAKQDASLRRNLQMKAADAFLAEYARLRDETFSVESRYDRLMAVAVTLLGALIVYAMKEKRKEVFLVLPCLVYALVLYVLHFFHAMQVRAGYLRAIEAEINRILGRRVFLWENHLVPKFLCLTGYPAALGFNAAVLILILVIVVYSHYVVLVDFPTVLFADVQFALSAIFAVWTGWSLWVSTTVSRVTCDFSNSLLSTEATEAEVQPTRKQEFKEVGETGAADKGIIQGVEVPPHQLPASGG